MTESLRNLLRYISPFSDGQLDEVISCFKPVKIKKNAVLLSEEETCRHFYFVYKGCIRTFYNTREGEEKTRYIMSDLFIGTALTSFISQKPSFELIDALEDSELLAIDHGDFYRLVEAMPEWAAFYRKMLEMAYSFQSRKIESMVTLPAKQRYEKLLQESPALVKRISNKVLASYLDIRQETLSRLKSK